MKRNQRIHPGVAYLIREYFGRCPACAALNANSMGQLYDLNRAAICRRSNRSVTLRCPMCRLQWTLTLAQINKSLRHFAEFLTGVDLIDVQDLIRATDRPAARERRGRPAQPEPVLARRDAA